MMKRVVLSGALCVVLAGVAVGQTAPIWTKEPTAVLGAKIGVPINEVGLPACNGSPLGGQTCIETSLGGASGLPAVRSIRGHPFEYASFTVQVDDAGLVTGVKAWMKIERFAEFRQALAARYGRPTSESNSTVQSQAGAVYESSTAVWVGQKLSIFAYERGLRVDESIVVFSDNAAADRAAAARTQRVTGAASAL